MQPFIQRRSLWGVLLTVGLLASGVSAATIQFGTDPGRVQIDGHTNNAASVRIFDSASRPEALVPFAVPVASGQTLEQLSIALDYAEAVTSPTGEAWRAVISAGAESARLDLFESDGPLLADIIDPSLLFAISAQGGATLSFLEDTTFTDSFLLKGFSLTSTLFGPVTVPNLAAVPLPAGGALLLTGLGGLLYLRRRKRKS